jgi:hypothetical protein
MLACPTLALFNSVVGDTLGKCVGNSVGIVLGTLVATKVGLGVRNSQTSLYRISRSEEIVSVLNF